MSDLFNQHGAMFSECRKYRYALFRLWELNKPIVMFIGLNPSSANEIDNDPTIRRVIKFAFNNDYGGLYMMNLFAWVTPNPKELLTCDDPVGQNDKWLEKFFYKCDDVVFCWGAFSEAKERAEKIIEKFPGALCLGMNADGSPKHPLYLPASTQLITYDPILKLSI